ncbi:MAG: A/G-specific adenine glycosylase [Candidatus Binatia bacterium]
MSGWRFAHPSTIRAFQHRLITWYEKHGRDLPWRRTRDPYAILVSEVMLQQTQVQRAILYYERFLQRYPTVEELARADEPAVRETWEGLGYYARARNLQRTSQKIVNEYNGQFPKDPAELETLPGIGPYTAGAVASFAFGKDAAILDTNAERVLTRFFALPAERQSQRFLWEVAHQVTPAGKAHLFNQAIMDIGATICVARTPRCTACPLRPICKSAPLYRKKHPPPTIVQFRRKDGLRALQ